MSAPRPSRAQSTSIPGEGSAVGPARLASSAIRPRRRPWPGRHRRSRAERPTAPRRRRVDRGWPHRLQNGLIRRPDGHSTGEGLARRDERASIAQAAKRRSPVVSTPSVSRPGPIAARRLPRSVARREEDPRARLDRVDPSAPGSTITSNDGPNARPSVHRLSEPGTREGEHRGIISEVVGDAPHADDLEVEQWPLRSGPEILGVELLGSERGQRKPVTGADAADRARSSFTTTSLSTLGAGSRPSTKRTRSMSWRNAGSGLLTTAMSNSVALLNPM